MLRCQRAGRTGATKREYFPKTGTASSYSGNAFGIRARGLIAITATPSVTLPSTGGHREKSLITLTVPGLLTSQTLHVLTHGNDVHTGPNASESRASVEDLEVGLAGLVITAEVIVANSRAECVNGQVRLAGETRIVGLTINGNAVVVTGAPNQRVLLPGGLGVIVINEQRRPNANTIVVNALVVRVNNVLTGGLLEEVIVSHAQSDIFCGPAPSPSPSPKPY